MTMPTGFALAAFEPSAGAGAVRSYPETRIGAFDFYVGTCTEPLWCGSADAQRACGNSWPRNAEGLCCFIQEDPLGFLSGPNRFGYVRGNPTRAGDPLGLFDWVRDVLEPVSNFSAGFGDTISLGLTYRIRDLTGANSVVDPCDFWYSAGDKAGIAHSLALGGASAARGALAMGGRSGTVLARLARGGGRFFSDPRTYGTVGKQYWKARGGAGVMSLHHWLLPQRAGALNAGWNLLEVPGAFNSWMGYSSVGRGVEWGLRFAIPGSLLGAAIEGAFWGISKDEWQKNCGCGQ